MKIIKSIKYTYSKLSNFGKLLIFLALFLLIVAFFKNVMALKTKEGFTQDNKFLYRENNEVYDDFYATIYDHLVYNAIKNEYECGVIVKETNPSGKSVIADIGCGTGHHVARLSDEKLNVIGVDISKSMIKQAKTNHPNCKFKVGDALDVSIFGYNSLTHVLCLYFTIYYFKDKRQFFDNCMDWLMPGGYLFIHLVSRDQFDPILPPGNPLIVVSPQKYAKKRITTTKVKFTDFSYSADFKFDATNPVVKFVEKFKKDDSGNVRKNEHTLYMDSQESILTKAQEAGFIIEGKIDLVKAQYEYQFVYILVKPN